MKREHNKEEVQRYRRWELDQEQCMRSGDITGVGLVLHRNRKSKPYYTVIYCSKKIPLQKYDPPGEISVYKGHPEGLED